MEAHIWRRMQSAALKVLKSRFTSIDRIDSDWVGDRSNVKTWGRSRGSTITAAHSVWTEASCQWKPRLKEHLQTKHPAQTKQEWLGDNSKCPWADQQSLESNLIKYLWRDWKTSPIQPDRAWEDLQRRMSEYPKINLCQASTHYRVKGLKPCVSSIFKHL